MCPSSGAARLHDAPPYPRDTFKIIVWYFGQLTIIYRGSESEFVLGWLGEPVTSRAWRKVREGRWRVVRQAHSRWSENMNAQIRQARLNCHSSSFALLRSFEIRRILEKRELLAEPPSMPPSQSWNGAWDFFLLRITPKGKCKSVSDESSESDSDLLQAAQALPIRWARGTESTYGNSMSNLYLLPQAYCNARREPTTWWIA
jgi:hypothetical protein